MRELIDTLLPCCERHGRLLVMRTWSVGIGALGDLLWSPERYQAVFGGYTSPRLLVSIKHGPANFFRLLPHNPTLGLPGPRQIIELQNRREYELFGMVPSSIAELHGEVLRHAETTNPALCWCVGVEQLRRLRWWSCRTQRGGLERMDSIEQRAHSSLGARPCL